MSTDAERYLAYADVRASGKVGDKAVLLVSKYGLSQKRASEALGVDRGVVRRALAAHSEGREIGRNGRPESLSVQEKEELSKSIEKMIEEHDSPTKRGVAEEANRILKNRVLSKTIHDDTATLESIQAQITSVTPYWAREWIKKNSLFEMVKPRMVEKERSEGCRKSIIEGWFATWEKEVANDEIFPSMLANFDETMIQPQQNSSVKVVGYRDSKATVKCSDPGLPHITLGVTIFADATSTKHLLIYPNKFVPQEIRGANAANFINYILAGQESGWITQDLFASYCRETIIPAFLERRKRLETLGVNNAIGVFLVDGHSSRLNSSLMEEFRMNGIKVPVLPSHASHVLQPLDLAVFGVFKSALSKGDSSLRRLTLPDRRGAIMLKARKALHLALCTDTILASFQKSGLYPYNPSLPLQHPCILLAEESNDVVIDEGAKGGGDRYNMSGKVITNLAEIEAIRRVESKKEQRKASKLSPKSTPKCDSSLSDPLNMLPSLPKRRGRPPKVGPVPSPIPSLSSALNGEI